MLGRVAYEISSGLTAGVNVSYDEAFETRVSADLKVRFGGAATTAQRKEVQQRPVINALTTSPRKRDVRVHDSIALFIKCVKSNPTPKQLDKLSEFPVIILPGMSDSDAENAVNRALDNCTAIGGDVFSSPAPQKL